MYADQNNITKPFFRCKASKYEHLKPVVTIVTNLLHLYKFALHLKNEMVLILAKTTVVIFLHFIELLY